ncbi:MAG: LptF/LptG family permease [Treponema sp.]|nr:LptF/LptG family permease [Treponema sp.]MBQ4237283.1 LptF/LptG family permease [Treponema sp.]
MTLIKYMLKRFAVIFFGSLFFFVLILCLTDLLMNLWNYISKNVSILVVGKILLYYIPKTVWYAVPIAMLFATAYMLSDLYARNELLAVFASGVSLFKFTVPLLVIAFLMSFGLFFFEDNVVVQTYAKKNELQNGVLNKTQSLNSEQIVIMSEEGRIIYKAQYYDDSFKRLYDLIVIFRDEEKKFDRMIRAESAVWGEGKWELSGADMFMFEDDVFVKKTPDEKYSGLLTEVPETFQNNTVNVEEVSTKEARQYIEHLENAGLPSAEAKSQLYKKYAFPFVVFVVVFLAIGLSGKARKNVLIISLALSIGAAVIFYITQMMTMLMAKFEVIPPLVGAWFPVIFFVLLSLVLLRFSRT